METEIQDLLFSNDDNFKEDKPLKNVNSWRLLFLVYYGYLTFDFFKI